VKENENAERACLEVLEFGKEEVNKYLSEITGYL